MKTQPIYRKTSCHYFKIHNGDITTVYNMLDITGDCSIINETDDGRKAKAILESKKESSEQEFNQHFSIVCDKINSLMLDNVFYEAEKKDKYLAGCLMLGLGIIACIVIGYFKFCNN